VLGAHNLERKQKRVSGIEANPMLSQNEKNNFADKK
jgi:hypothetical protein